MTESNICNLPPGSWDSHVHVVNVREDISFQQHHCDIILTHILGPLPPGRESVIHAETCTRIRSHGL